MHLCCWAGDEPGAEDRGMTEAEGSDGEFRELRIESHDRFMLCSGNESFR